MKQLFLSVIRIIKVSWKDHPWLNLGLISIAILTSLAGFAQEAVLALVINALTGKSVAWLSTNNLIILFIVSLILPALVLSAQTIIEVRSWRDFYHSWMMRMLKKRISLDIARYEDPAFQDLLNKVEEKGSHSITNIATSVSSLLQHIITVFLSIGVLWVAEPLIVVVVICAYAPYLYVRIKYGDEVHGVWDTDGIERRRFWDMRRHIEHRDNIAETILFQNGHYLWNKIRSLLKQFTQKQNDVDKRLLFFEVSSIVLAHILIGFCVVWLIQRAFAGIIAVGTFTFFIASILRLQTSLKSFFMLISREYENALFSIDYFKLLDTEPHISISSNPHLIDTHRTPLIEFKDVSFSYPGSSKYIFEQFNLSINPGEKVAIVGINGAGKTTLMKLLARIYDPTEGVIYVDGVDLKTIDLERWRSMIGILFQDFNKYNFLAKESIQMGNIASENNIDHIVASAIESGSHDFITEWTDQYNQQIGREFGGIDPSKGQNQKLALSRTFFRNPRIMVLDEPTASVDAEAEQRIFDNLDAGPKERTTILISHRFSTVRNVDTIVVIDHGRIIEKGTHDELMKKKGTYQRLFTLQAKGYQ